MSATFNFAGGVTAATGWGQRDRLRFVGTWAEGEYWTWQVTSAVGDFTLGAGNLYGASYSFLLTYGEKLYAANGTNWNFSAVGDPTGWEEQDIGAGAINFQTSFGFVDEAVSLGVMQGRLAVFGRRNIQIWTVDADPSAYQRIQVLQNIGTVAPRSVQSIGELDLIFLDDTGVRSLRTRETTLNAYVEDLGSPIDEILQPILAGLTDEQKATATSVVEPNSKRYWVCVNGTIYVLSQFPMSGILAWSTYEPTYHAFIDPSTANYSSGGVGGYTGLVVGRTYYWTKGANDTSLTSGTTILTASGEFVAEATTASLVGTASAAITCFLEGGVSFTPEWITVKDGRIYIRSTNGLLFLYGGTDGVTYDKTVPTVTLPWLDLEKPSQVKIGKGIDVAQKGKWHAYVSMNPRASSPVEVRLQGSATSPNVLNDSTFDTGHYPYSGAGTHFQLKFKGYMAATEQKLSKAVFLYDEGNVK